MYCHLIMLSELKFGHIYSCVQMSAPSFCLGNCSCFCTTTILYHRGMFTGGCGSGHPHCFDRYLIDMQVIDHMIRTHIVLIQSLLSAAPPLKTVKECSHVQLLFDFRGCPLQTLLPCKCQQELLRYASLSFGGKYRFDKFYSILFYRKFTI